MLGEGWVVLLDRDPVEELTPDGGFLLALQQSCLQQFLVGGHGRKGVRKTSHAVAVFEHARPWRYP